LVLNIYLLYLVIDKQKEADIGVIEREDTTIEEQLESEDITYIDLPEVKDEEPFLSVEQKVFDSKDASSLDKFSNQDAAIIDENIIISVFDKPIQLPSNAKEQTIISLLKDDILYQEEYECWSWNEEYYVLVFFQKKNERPIYFNRGGMVLFFLNKENEVSGYIQTMLGESEEGEENKSLIQPIKAIETLYLSNKLNSGEKVTKMKIGYHTRVPLSDGMQVFVPTWKVSVNDERNYFINAIEGFIFSGNDNDFLHETISTYEDNLHSVSIEDTEVKEMILEQLSSRLDKENGSEEYR